MASGSLTAAALRHRPRQAALLVVLAAVVTASASLGPLYARATEQSILRTVLAAAPAAERGIVATSTTSTPPSPQLLARAVRRVPSASYGTPVSGAETDVTVGGFSASSGSAKASAQLTNRTGLCRHLVLVAGTCIDPQTDDGSVLISKRNAATLDIGVGDQLRISDPNQDVVTLAATVTGIYQAFDATGDYWFGRHSNAAIPPPREGEASPISLDAVYASWPTMRSTQFSEVRTHTDVPLRIDRMDLRSLTDARRDADLIRAQVLKVQASTVTALPSLVAASNSQRRQARTVIPLLAIQLATLGVVMLAFVCAAATEGRRPEVALARLRGQRSAGAGALLLRELGLLVVVGTLVGAAAGWLVARVATARWLAPGVQLELRWPVLVAVAASAVAGVAAVLGTAAPTLRQPLVALLRRVPPRASALQVGLVEGALVAAAAAGEVTLLATGGGAAGTTSGGSQSPVALLAPGLLAVAGGLLLAQAVVPVSGPLARRALRKGNVVSALAATQVARRPALRRLIAIITVACALLVFAADTWEVASRNRVVRAGFENGAPVVLSVDAKDAGALRSAVLGFDPRQRFATPVVTASSADPLGPRTTAVEPAAFARIARWGSAERRPSSAALRKLDAETVAPLRLTGQHLRLDVQASFKVVRAELGKTTPPSPLRLVLHLRSVRDGHSFALTLPRPLRQGASSYDTSIPCADGCLLHAVEVQREFFGSDGFDLTFAIVGMRAGENGTPGTRVDLGPASQAAWQAIANENDDEVTVDWLHPIMFSGMTYGSSLTVQRGDLPITAPALIAGDVLEHGPNPTFPDPPADAPDVTGVVARYDPAGRLTAIPRSGTKGVLVNLDLLDKSAPPTTDGAKVAWLPTSSGGASSSLHGTASATTRSHWPPKAPRWLCGWRCWPVSSPSCSRPSYSSSGLPPRRRRACTISPACASWVCPPASYARPRSASTSRWRCSAPWPARRSDWPPPKPPCRGCRCSPTRDPVCR